MAMRPAAHRRGAMRPTGRVPLDLSPRFKHRDASRPWSYATQRSRGQRSAATRAGRPARAPTLTASGSTSTASRLAARFTPTSPAGGAGSIRRLESDCDSHLAATDGLDAWRYLCLLASNGVGRVGGRSHRLPEEPAPGQVRDLSCGSVRAGGRIGGARALTGDEWAGPQLAISEAISCFTAFQ